MKWTRTIKHPVLALTVAFCEVWINAAPAAFAYVEFQQMLMPQSAATTGIIPEMDRVLQQDMAAQFGGAFPQLQRFLETPTTELVDEPTLVVLDAATLEQSFDFVFLFQKILQNHAELAGWVEPGETLSPQMQARAAAELPLKILLTLPDQRVIKAGGVAQAFDILAQRIYEKSGIRMDRSWFVHLASDAEDMAANLQAAQSVFPRWTAQQTEDIPLNARWSVVPDITESSLNGTSRTVVDFFEQRVPVLASPATMVPVTVPSTNGNGVIALDEPETVISSRPTSPEITATDSETIVQAVVGASRLPLADSVRVSTVDENEEFADAEAVRSANRFDRQRRSTSWLMSSATGLIAALTIAVTTVMMLSLNTLQEQAAYVVAGVLAFQLTLAVGSLLNEWGHVMLAQTLGYSGTMNARNLTGNRRWYQWVLSLIPGLPVQSPHVLVPEIDELLHEVGRNEQLIAFYSDRVATAGPVEELTPEQIQFVIEQLEITGTRFVIELPDRYRSLLALMKFDSTRLNLPNFKLLMDNLSNDDRSIRQFGGGVGIAMTIMAGAGVLMVLPEALVIPLIAGLVFSVSAQALSDFAQKAVRFGLYYCGVSTVSGPDWETALNISEALRRKMNVRGDHSSGFEVYLHDAQGAVYADGDKKTGPKRGNLTQMVTDSMTAKTRALAANREIGRARILSHVRVSTSTPGDWVDGAHPHMFGEVREGYLWDIEQGQMRRKPNPQGIGVRIAHNGDFDDLEIFGKHRGVRDVWQWLNRHLYADQEWTSDSVNISGVLSLFRAQGDPYAAVRLGYQFAKERAANTDFKQERAWEQDPLPESQLDAFAQIFEQLLEDYGTRLGGDGIDSFADVPLDSPQFESMVEELRRRLVAAGLKDPFWVDAEDGFARLVAEESVKAFLVQDLPEAMAGFVERAIGSFGLAAFTEMDDVEVFYPFGQPLAIGYNRDTKFMSVSSESASLKTLYADPETGEMLPAFTHRLQLDQVGGEMVVTSIDETGELVLKIFSVAMNRWLTDAEIERRWIPIHDNAKVSKLVDEAPADNLVGYDLSRIPQMLQEIQADWQDETSLNRQTQSEFTDFIIERIAQRQQGLRPDKYDLILGGEHESHWQMRQFADQLERHFGLRVKVISDVGEEAGSNALLLDPEAMYEEMDEYTGVFLASQSGQTYSTNQAAAWFAEAAPNRVWLMTGELDTIMAEAIGQRYGADDPWLGRVFENGSGWSRAEASTRTNIAANYTLSEIFLNLASDVAREFPEGLQGADMFTYQQVNEILIPVMRDGLIEAATEVVGYDENAQPLGQMTETQRQLNRQGEQWAGRILEPLWVRRATFAVLAIMFIAGHFAGIAPNTVIDLLPMVQAMPETVVLTARVLVDLAFYFTLGWTLTFGMRLARGYSLSESMGAMTLFFADRYPVHKLAKSTVGKMVSQQFPIASLKVDASEAMNATHDISYMLGRTSWMLMGVPDTRKAGLADRGGAHLMSAKQGKATRHVPMKWFFMNLRRFLLWLPGNWGKRIVDKYNIDEAGPTVVTLSTNPTHDTFAADRHIALPALHDMDIDDPALNQFLDERGDSMVRLLGMYQLTHAMAHRVSTEWGKKYQEGVLQAGLNVQTTPSAVSGNAINQHIKKLREERRKSATQFPGAQPVPVKRQDGQFPLRYVPAVTESDANFAIQSRVLQLQVQEELDETGIRLNLKEPFAVPYEGMRFRLRVRTPADTVDPRYYLKVRDTHGNVTIIQVQINPALENDWMQVHVSRSFLKKQGIVDVSEIDSVEYVAAGLPIGSTLEVDGDVLGDERVLIINELADISPVAIDPHAELTVFEDTELEVLSEGENKPALRYQRVAEDGVAPHQDLVLHTTFRGNLSDFPAGVRVNIPDAWKSRDRNPRFRLRHTIDTSNLRDDTEMNIVLEDKWGNRVVVPLDLDRTQADEWFDVALPVEDLEAIVNLDDIVSVQFQVDGRQWNRSNLQIDARIFGTTQPVLNSLSEPKLTRFEDVDIRILSEEPARHSLRYRRNGDSETRVIEWNAEERPHAVLEGLEMVLPQPGSNVSRGGIWMKARTDGAEQLTMVITDDVGNTAVFPLQFQTETEGWTPWTVVGVDTASMRQRGIDPRKVQSIAVVSGAAGRLQIDTHAFSETLPELQRQIAPVVMAVADGLESSAVGAETLIAEPAVTAAATLPAEVRAQTQRVRQAVAQSRYVPNPIRETAAESFESNANGNVAAVNGSGDTTAGTNGVGTRIIAEEPVPRVSVPAVDPVSETVSIASLQPWQEAWQAVLQVPVTGTLTLEAIGTSPGELSRRVRQAVATQLDENEGLGLDVQLLLEEQPEILGLPLDLETLVTEAVLDWYASHPLIADRHGVVVPARTVAPKPDLLVLTTDVEKARNAREAAGTNFGESVAMVVAEEGVVSPATALLYGLERTQDDQPDPDPAAYRMEESEDDLLLMGPEPGGEHEELAAMLDEYRNDVAASYS